jgi:TRAP-type C4-dicarboxylate transport system substrate-binding protein
VRAPRPTLRWATVLPTNHPSVAMMSEVAKEVREKTGGAVEIQTFPAGQLGSSRDVIESTSSGRDPDRRRRRGAVRPVRAAVLDPRGALHLA